MQGEREKPRDTNERSDRQPAATAQDQANPVGQDSARSEYGEIGGQPGRRSHIEGEGFILQQDSGPDEPRATAPADGAVKDEGDRPRPDRSKQG